MSAYRIMAVDDNEDTLNVIKMTLEDSYYIMTVSDPMDFYEMLKFYRPHLIILDIMMPKITGFQILDILQHRDEYKNIPVVILSAKEQAREIRHGYRLGAKLYITKPFTAERLKRNIDLQLQKDPPKDDEVFNLDDVMKKLQYSRSFQKGKVNFSGPNVDAKEWVQEKLRQTIDKARQIQEDSTHREPWVD